MKHKNNQSLDTKIDKHIPGHLKYTTLLKDKKQEKKNKTSHEIHKDGKVKKNKYFSAPVSTKENGLVTKFKFHDKKNDTQKLVAKDSTAKLDDRKYSASSKGSYKRGKKLKVTPVQSDSQLINIESKTPNSGRDIEDLSKYDISMPKNDDIQRIFSDAVNSPSDKVIHMSVINSFDNFEELKKSSDSARRNYLENQNDDIKKENNKMKDIASNKAAVPILDFTQLPHKVKKESKNGEPSPYDDMELGSNSIGSIFDQESHLDLSSKRLKKLILTSDFSSLLNLREEAVRNKADKEKEKLDNLIKTNKISPRTGKARALKLEKWIIREKEEIRKAKRIFEEAKKNTEDVVKETELNGNFLKQMISDKVTTPREGLSMRSGMNSSRRRFELQNKQLDSDKEGSEYQEKLSSTNSKDFDPNQHIGKPKICHDQDERELDEILEKYGNKELDLTKGDKSDLDVMVSVDTPKADSQNESSFHDTQKIIIGPKESEGDSSSDTNLMSSSKAKPLDLTLPPTPPDLSAQSLSRKKSEQRLSDLHSKMPLKPENPKSTVTPTPQSKPPINPFNSDKFFTQDFDDQPMDVAIENLVNSSGKLGIKGDPEIELKQQVVKNKIIKTKDSRNLNIKKSENKEKQENLLQSDEKKKYYGINDDVEFLKKNTGKVKVQEDSRNQKKAQQVQQKSSKSNESYKEEFVLDDISDKDISDDEKTDPKNITGSQSLDNNLATPETPAGFIDDIESNEKVDRFDNSDSKYATVSILAELNQKELAEQEETSRIKAQKKLDKESEIDTGNKLADLIYSAMLAEIKAELFPPRPLFLLTADLEKIDLDQALVYLNDMSVEKEAALLKEYLKYSSGDDIDFSAWDDDKNDKDSDENKMFSDSGKLVLYERKGIATDLFAIEQYVDELSSEVDAKCKSKFLTDTFTPIKKDALETLNQLQNSDIG